MEQARDKAYANAARVQFQGAYFRKDIALRAIPPKPVEASPPEPTPGHPEPVEG